jgi:transposase
MEVLHRQCAGLDVHKETVVAAVRIARRGKVKRETREFGTCTRDLCELSDWLEEHEVTHAVMESTGVYWKPVWHVLEGTFELVLANAGEVRNVPGRKSDVSDAQWLSDLLAHGLVRSSYVPERPTQELRGLTRTRKQLVREAGRHVQRIQKTLEDANVKLSSVLSNVVGMSGRAILEALIRGEEDPEKLAALATARVKATREEIVESLRGRVTAYHRFELQLHLRLLDEINRSVKEVEERIGDALEPFRELVERLTTIPGVDVTTAHVILGEVGLDVSRFPTAANLVSWAGLCPRMDESAGKRKSTRIRKGAPWLKTALVQAAWAAVKVKNSYLQAQYLRLKARRGPKKAIVAVASSMLVAAYHMLRDGTDYTDLGGGFFDRRDKSRVTSRLVRRLNDLGYDVLLKPAA